ncbi:MAG: hypothetical protein IPL40_04385 [Proteobacteria bacterium]|nr:hypothetical protein [Pseudomonadota bacterium]
MDITQTVAAASVAGAALFYAGGYLTRALRRGGGLPADDPAAAAEPGPPAAERDRLERELARARSGVQAAQEARDRLQAERDAVAGQHQAATSEAQRELARLRAALVQQEETSAARGDEAKQARVELQRQVDEAKQARVEVKRKAEETARLQAELQRLGGEAERAHGAQEQQAKEFAQARRRAEQALAEAERNERRRQDLEVELEAQRGALQEAVSAAQRASAEGQARAAKLQEDLKAAEARAALRGAANDAQRLEQLQNEHAELTQQLAQLRASSVPADEVEQLRGKQRHMLVQARMMQQQLGEMEEHARENVGLKQQLERAQTELATAEARSQALRRAEARLLAAGLTVDDAAPPRPLTASPTSATAPRANALEQQLARLVAPGAAHAVVLADERGLQLAAAGVETYHEALAVLSAHVAELHHRASELLPFGDARSLLLVDRNGLSIGAQLFHAAGQGFLVAALGSSLEQRQELGEVLEAVTEIVER